MRESIRNKRRGEIESVAYDVLETNGYGGTSMLNVAKAANASNETLYRWYGDKQGLFIAMVRSNAADIRHMLEQALDKNEDPKACLCRVAPLFLSMILGKRAILLNRAAAADPSGTLGEALAKGGRDEILPLIQTLIAQLGTQDNKQTSEWFIGLLVGDLQMRRAIGQLPVPTPSEIKERADAALATFFTLIEQ